VRIRGSKEADGKDIWLGGGGDPATALFPEIDDLIRKVDPLMLRAGIPLLGGAVKQIGLERTGNKIYGNGSMPLRSRVNQKRVDSWLRGQALRLEGLTNRNACPNLGPPAALLVVVPCPQETPNVPADRARITTAARD
jgi:hypothetical protein